MILDFAKLDLREPPVLILKNAGGLPIGVLGNVIGLAPDIKYNETSVLEFDLPYSVDGKVCPFYDDVVGMRVVELKDLGQFILLNPRETTDGVDRRKSCKAYSLEYEFAMKNITISAGTHNFWDPYDQENCIVGMMLEAVPGWRVGNIPDSLMNRYRTIEASSENVYNLMKGTLQESFGCIFDFDTLNRLVNVRDVNDVPKETPVYISPENLASEIEVEEDTENVITRLDVSGAEGVNIRDVNPTGTNQIINLDYFMNTTNFEQSLIDKYYAWKTQLEANMEPFYSLSTDYTMAVMKKATADAELTDLQGELTSLESQQAVIIQAIAQKIKTQTDLDSINVQIASKKAEIAAATSDASDIQSEIESIMEQMVAIRSACSFESHFSEAELLEMNHYIKDGSISDSTFVAIDVGGFDANDIGERIADAPFEISGAQITSTSNASNRVTFSVTGGTLLLSGNISASVISATIETKENGSAVFSARLNAGKIDGVDFPSACITYNGTITGMTHDVTPGSSSGVMDGTHISFTCESGYLYFTYNVSTYDKRSVAWDLYQYGYNTLQKLSQPAYIFRVTSANFFSVEDFLSFKNNIELGQKLYVGLADGRVLSPICIGGRFNYDKPDDLELEFGDSYTSSDSTFRLVDLLNKSISMGKSVDASKYVNSAYVDSGAEVGIKTFINSALDVAKNANLSSSDQAISWDAAGLRLRKWANESQTAYEDEQIWMSNNSIMMTDDGWNTAELAIGKFYDENLGGEFWGIVASRVFGTMIAGGNLLIESEKQDGDVATFRLDGDGCRIYNADMAIASETRHIFMNPDIGFAMGKFPVFTQDEDTGVKTLNEANANFWIDIDGNVHMRGVLEAASGVFEGDVRATSLTIVSSDSSGDQDIGDYVQGVVDSSVTTEIENQLTGLRDEIDGKSTTFYSATDPLEDDTNAVSSGDVWYDTANGLIWRYGGTAWVDITDTALKSALDAAGDAQATADSKIVTFAQNNAPSPSISAVGDLWVDTNDNNKLYRYNGSRWIEYSDSRIATINSTLSALIDTVDGKTDVFYSSSEPDTASDGDLWYDSEGAVYRYSESSNAWIKIENTDLASALEYAEQALATADQKITTYSQASMPTTADVGDLWFDTDDNNKLYRWEKKSNGTYGWVEHRDSLITKVQNGTVGIVFSSSIVEKVQIDNTVGIKVIGENEYFQAMNNAMGFFRIADADAGETTDTPLMYCKNGNLTLTGTVQAVAGFIGSNESDGWTIGDKAIYSGSASTVGSASGTYIGTDGISVGNAILMRDDGTFIIRGDDQSTSDDNYVFKITPEVTTIATGSGSSVTSTKYKLAIGQVEFDGEFIIPVKNGGTGANSPHEAGVSLGVYRAMSESALESIAGSSNGDIGVLYSTGDDVSSFSGGYTTSASLSPTYLSVTSTNYGGNHAASSVLGVSGVDYWNISGYYDDNVSTSYARVGGGTWDVYCGLCMPLSVSVTGSGSLTSIDVTFTYNTSPSGNYVDLITDWRNPIIVRLYKVTTSGYTQIASTTFMLPDSYQKRDNMDRSARVTLTCTDGNSISSTVNGTTEYRIMFYKKSRYSQIWVKPASITIDGTAIGSTYGIYIKSGGLWSPISGSGTGASFVLSPATKTSIGGVIIGDNFDVDSTGKISMLNAGYGTYGAVTTTRYISSGSGVPQDPSDYPARYQECLVYNGLVYYDKIINLTSSNYGDSLPTGTVPAGRLFFKRKT